MVPEGHTIHRLARDLGADLTDAPVRASSPQGRFSEGAARLDGTTTEGCEAWGKNLFVTSSAGDVLHIHLGLIGKMVPRSPDTAPGDTVRLRLEGRERAWHLTGPQTCALISPDERDLIVTELGPDPLRRGPGRRSRFVERFRATRRPAGAALLDQRIVAGIGNVYRAELLFLSEIHPERPAAEIEADAAGELWDLTVEQLRRGLDWNRIVTVREDDVGRRVTRRIRRHDALYAYKRTGQPCRRCRTPIEDRKIAARTIWFCPTCQAA